MSSKIKKNGIINGGVIGFIYILLIYLISSITGVGFSININSIIMIICASISRNGRRNNWGKYKEIIMSEWTYFIDIVCNPCQ